MDITIRTDSSVHIGLGHVMRCLVLARELKSHGHVIKFATRPQNGDSISFIKAQGFLVHELPRAEECLPPKNSSDYAAWLQVPVELDVEQFISMTKCTDMVIVDHYALSAEWQYEVKNQLKCKIVVIDDIVRKHNADLIIDQTLMRIPAEYQSVNDIHNILTGCDYALLNPQFIPKRELALENNILPTEIKVLLSMGGIDKDNVTLKILKVLQSQLVGEIKVTVLLGSKSPSYKEVKDFCILNHDWIEHIGFVDDMAEIMLAHALAIGAPGTTSWERACLGIPNIIIPLADNQRNIAKNLVTANASILVEKKDISLELVSSYKSLLKNWQEYRQNNLRLCDGLGVRRIVKSIDNLLLEQGCRLTIERATNDDIKQVFMWQSHPDTRKFALTQKIPAWEKHEEWMKEKLKSVEDFFYMINMSDYNNSVGVIRLDRVSKAEYIVSIFISPEHFGQGIAKQALSFIDAIHKDVTLHATVLEGNIASQRLFTTANYMRVSTDKFIRLPIT